MNKIVLKIGLLIFCLSIVFFAQQGMPIQEVIIRSLIVFVFLTIMISIFVLVFMKSINHATLRKNKEL